MKLHTARITVYCLTAFTVLAGLIAIVTRSTAPIIVTVAGLAAELTVFFAFVKCPHCKRHLDKAGMNPDTEFCPFCGEPLKEEEEQ